MKLINLVLFIVILNMFSAAVVTIPDNTVDPVNSGYDLFETSGFGAEKDIYDEAEENLSVNESSQYKFSSGEDSKTSALENIFGKFIQLGKGVLEIINHVLFGITNIISMALGSPEAGPVRKVIGGIKIVMSAMWLIIFAYFLRGLSTD